MTVGFIPPPEQRRAVEDLRRYAELRQQALQSRGRQAFALKAHSGLQATGQPTINHLDVTAKEIDLQPPLLAQAADPVGGHRHIPAVARDAAADRYG